MKLNPEFVRNAWLELTPQRLAGAPLLLAAVFLISYFANDSVSGIPDLALIGFVAVTVFWGTRLASDTLNDEFAQGTWDTQRLSGLGAGSMTLGKLLGGPIFAWYTGLFCIAAMLLTTPAAELDEALRKLLLAMGVAITFHATALLSALQLRRRLPQPAQRPAVRGANIVFLFLFLPQLLIARRTQAGIGPVTWYGLEFAALDFALLCAALAAFWSVFGLYRSMREELAFSDPPVAWIAFLLFLFAFSGGWIWGVAEVPEIGVLHSPLLVHLAVCAAIAGAMAYLMLFAERKDWVRLRRLAACAGNGEHRRAFALTPKWLATVALFALVVVVLGVAALLLLPVLDGIAVAATALAFLIFLVRDGALVLGCNFVRDQRRSDSAAALYIAVLYVLLPLLLGALNLQFMLGAVLPPMIYAQPPWIVVGLLQAAAALDFARNRWNALPA